MVNTYRIREVESHYVVYGEGPSLYGPRVPRRLHPDGQCFWAFAALGECERAFIATCRQKLVGFFRFSLYECSRSPGASFLIAGGTWIHPEHRRAKLASRLWEKTIHSWKIPRPHVPVLADRSASLSDPRAA